jgi:hypothetical protein
MTEYTRQEVFIDGDVIEAAHANNEFDRLVAVFNAATGHTHSGIAAEGAPVPLISDTTGTDKVEVVAGGAKTTGTHQVTGVLTADVGVTATTGDITATAGDIVATAGDVVLTAGNVTLAALATVDGRDLSVDGTKLDSVEAAATADQTNAEIKTAYELNADTNEFSDAEQTKLAGIETAATADQTGAQIKTAYQAEPNAFTDAQFTKLGGIETSATADQTGAEIKTAYQAEVSAFTDAQFTKLAGIEAAATADQTNAEIKTAYELNADTNEFSDAEQTKLSGIETGATAEVAATLTVPGIIELATQAEVDTGTDAVRAVTPATLAAATTTGVFSQSFLSTEQTITSAGLLTLAHSLGSMPTLVQFRLICKVADNGYSIGDEVVVNNSVDGALSVGIAATLDATNLSIRMGGLAQPFSILNKTTGTITALVNTSWRFIARAWV